jgi:hypothetical protein
MTLASAIGFLFGTHNITSGVMRIDPETRRPVPLGEEATATMRANA